MQRRTVNMPRGAGVASPFGPITSYDLEARGIHPVRDIKHNQVSGCMLLPFCVADAVELWNRSIGADTYINWNNAVSTTTAFGALTKTAYLDDIVLNAYRIDIEREANAKERHSLHRKLKKAGFPPTVA